MDAHGLRFGHVIFFALKMKALMLVVGVVSTAFGVLMLFASGTLSTRYAPDYSEDGFKRIRSGMNTNEVLRLVGRPLDGCGSEYYGHYWWYTEYNGRGIRRYKLRALRVTNGVVAEVSRRVDWK